MLHEFTFKSYNQRDSVCGWIYVPSSAPKGIIQLVHGYSEHSRVYLHMISDFLEHDYIVVADDHVGHGKTALINNSWGDWGRMGSQTMMEDEKLMHDLTVKLYPDLPYFMFGFSLGSTIVRQYMAVYGSDLQAVTLCGTVNPFPNIEELIAELQQKVNVGQGEVCDPELPGRIFGWTFKRIRSPKYGNEYLSDDEDFLKDRINDPLCTYGKPVTNRTFLYFLQMVDEVNSREWALRVPASIAVYNIGGDEDPFGEYGTGLMKVSGWLLGSGHYVKSKLYPGKRHEIHSYHDIWHSVEDGITNFFDRYVPRRFG